MASMIFEYANDVSFNRFTNIRRGTSNAGFTAAIKGSPTFYSLEANLKPLTKAEFNKVEAELLAMGDNLNLFTTSIPTEIDITNLVKEGTATSAEAEVANAIYTGITVTLVDASDISASDYIQFYNHTKVYQVVSKENDIITLNTSLIQPVDGGDTNPTVKIGSSVEFKLLLEEKPDVTVIPGPGYNYYQYGTFNFREVL